MLKYGTFVRRFLWPRCIRHGLNTIPFSRGFLSDSPEYVCSGRIPSKICFPSSALPTITYQGIKANDCTVKINSLIITLKICFRISGMVENLCLHWGTKVCDFPLNSTKTSFHSFPTIRALAEDPVALEAKLRTLGFGYRAGYIAKSAKKIQDNGGEEWLMGLRKQKYDDARMELLTLTGIGPKVLATFCLSRNGTFQSGFADISVPK